MSQGVTPSDGLDVLTLPQVGQLKRGLFLRYACPTPDHIQACMAVVVGTIWLSAPTAGSGRHSIMVRSIDADSKHSGCSTEPEPWPSGGCHATECTQSSCPTCGQGNEARTLQMNGCRLAFSHNTVYAQQWHSSHDLLRRRHVNDGQPR